MATSPAATKVISAIAVQLKIRLGGKVRKRIAASVPVVRSCSFRAMASRASDATKYASRFGRNDARGLYPNTKKDDASAK